MILTKNFELSVPTHISFVLYKYDYIDSIIISTVLKECKNYSTKSTEYKVKVDDFYSAITSSRRLNDEIKNIETYEEDSEYKPNSIYFLHKIINALVKSRWISFKISYDQNYSRLIKLDNNNEILGFNYKVEEGCIDLCRLLNRNELDLFNMMCIESNIMPNDYLRRKCFFYVNASDFLILLNNGLFNKNYFNVCEKIIESLDPKFNIDDTLFLIKTDYANY